MRVLDQQQGTHGGDHRDHRGVVLGLRQQTHAGQQTRQQGQADRDRVFLDQLVAVGKHVGDQRAVAHQMDHQAESEHRDRQIVLQVAFPSSAFANDGAAGAP